MIDFCVIFSSGGVVLWQHDESNVAGVSVQNLINEVLREEKQGMTQYQSGDYILKWSSLNTHKLYAVVGYLPIGIQSGVETFLTHVLNEFVKLYGEDLAQDTFCTSYADYTPVYDSLIDAFETGGFKTSKSSAKKTPASQQPPSTKKGKAKTVWDDTKLSETDAKALDLSADSPTVGNTNNNASSTSTSGTSSATPKAVYKFTNDDDEDDDEPSTSSKLWSYVQRFVGSKRLTEEDLAGIRKEFVDTLIQKNVTPEIANMLMDSVVKNLVGQTTGSLNTFHQLIKRELTVVLERLLAPKRKIDILTEISMAQKEKRPYSIVLCGVNGVGKSTSLAKLAAYFLSQDLKVGVVACDTFRSGAIEQLKTHCKALDIPLYDKGYGRDEATVASEGIIGAKKDNLDVVLIDTAGRMQGNEAFMKGLAKLMNLNNPDLILFVGEALVGNDGCDQLINFNRALANNSGKQNPRLIDGIILTKYDTIDDKCGAAISMTYSTSIPILFVGVGQTYSDLKRPSAKMFINALLRR